MNSSWLRIAPEALYWGPRNLAKVWNVKDIYITENGCSATDVPAADGIVYDTDRIMFLRNYLTHLQRATAEGVPVRGYFHWSLMDNFEWADGYGTRFGLLLRRLCHAEAHAEAERVVLPGGDRPQRGRVETAELDCRSREGGNPDSGSPPARG